MTKKFSVVIAGLALLLAAPAVHAAADIHSAIVVPVNRSTLVVLPVPMSEIMVANPDIADVHAHSSTSLSVVGKRIGQTNVRTFDKDGQLLREISVAVGYDLPAIRRSLKNFLPEENIGVEMVNTSVALTGFISNASVADKAIKIVSDFLQSAEKEEQQQNMATQAATSLAEGKKVPNIVNLMQVTSGQQVMLRVRVGEIQRSALKTLGIDLNMISRASGGGFVGLGTGSGLAGLAADDTGVLTSPGLFTLPDTPPVHGVLSGRWQPRGVNGNTYAGLLKALERDGLFKVLAEPNLVAVSGEQADFLSGGEIPIPVAQTNGGGGTNTTIEFKPFGVAVRFTPFVLSENRIRMQVQPEVSEISTANQLEVSGFTIPSIETRRAKTTVELAPGESFMIAGLISDQMRSSIDQLPGVKELPVLGALFRSTEFQRNETELVIAVTPYIIDPLKSSDVKLPTDDFRPASQMENFFYGALGTLAGNAPVISQSQGLEGPIGFMVE